MQQTESYEALNNSTFHFISCPNWGQDSNNYGTGNTCSPSAGNLLNVNGLTAKDNAENQIYSLNATLSGGSETISYDATGQRVQKSITGGPSTVFFYDAFGQLASESVNGAWTRDYIRGGSGNLVATENAPDGLCTTCYPSYDHLGSIRLVTDQNGNVVARHDYLPYGQEVSGYSGRTMAGFSIPSTSPTAPTDVTQKFTGQVRDQESGMDYFNAPYFTPALGRFNSPDPQNAGASLTSSQSWNGYAYVLNNPLAFTDPTGMDCGGEETDTGDCTEPEPPPPSGGTTQIDPSAFPCPTCNFKGSTTELSISSPLFTNPTSFTVGDLTLAPIDDSSLIGAGAHLNLLFGSLFGLGNNTTRPPSQTCPAVPFKITGIAPNQAPGTTAISQTPRAGIPNGGVAIKPGNFGVTASVRNSPGNAFDIYNYPSFSQALASTRNVMVTTSIPANSAGVKCPK